MEKKNGALLVKQLWRFPLVRTSSLWHSLSIARMEFIQTDGMETWLGMGPIEAPRKLSKEYPTSLSFVALEVRNEKAILFWEDKWRGDALLCEKFLHLY